MDNIGTVIVATISLIGTIGVGWFTFAAQRRKDDATAKSDLLRLQEEIETGLWKRLKSEIETLESRVNTLEQENDRLQLQLLEERNQRRELETRVMALEQENASLRRENDALRAATTKGRL